MSGSHGDLFREIGKLVLAAHAGQAIDLAAKSEELAARYENLGMPAELIAKAIARSLGAISVSMAIISNRGNGSHHVNGENGHALNGASGHGHQGAAAPIDDGSPDEEVVLAEPVESQAKAASALFPSGLRIAVLS